MKVDLKKSRRISYCRESQSSLPSEIPNFTSKCKANKYKFDRKYFKSHLQWHHTATEPHLNCLSKYFRETIFYTYSISLKRSNNNNKRQRFLSKNLHLSFSTSYIRTTVRVYCVNYKHFLKERKKMGRKKAAEEKIPHIFILLCGFFATDRKKKKVFERISREEQMRHILSGRIWLLRCARK